MYVISCYDAPGAQFIKLSVCHHVAVHNTFEGMLTVGTLKIQSQRTESNVLVSNEKRYYGVKLEIFSPLEIFLLGHFSSPLTV